MILEVQIPIELLVDFLEVRILTRFRHFDLGSERNRKLLEMDSMRLGV